MLKVYHIRHDFFIIQTEDFDIVVDPYNLQEQDLNILDNATPTYIFITHPHYDHYNKQDIFLIATRKPHKQNKLIFPETAQPRILEQDMLHELYPTQDKIILTKPNNIYSLPGNLRVFTIPAYNINKLRDDGKPFHPKQENWVGYIFELSRTYLNTDVQINAKYFKQRSFSPVLTIMHTGDSDNIPEYKNLPTNVDMLFVPVSGTYVMTSQEACNATKIIQAQYVIPMHYGEIVGTEQNAKDYLECIA